MATDDRAKGGQAGAMNKESRKLVVLVGIDRLLGLQLARILWRRGDDVVGVAVDERSHYCATRAANRILPAAPFLEDPCSALASLGAEAGQRPILIPCTDEFVWWLDANRTALSEHADFLLADSESLERLSDKARFCKEAAARGEPIPRTRIVTDPAELDEAAEALGFPLIVKPARRSPEWMRATGGEKVLKIEDGAGVATRVRPLFEVGVPIVLQSWIPGGDDCMYSVFVCLDRNHRPAMPPLVVQKLRQWPPETGVGCLARQVEAPDLAETALRFLVERDFVGTGSLQFKRDASTGRFLLIEMNTRFALSFPLCEASGLEATRIHCRLAAEEPVAAETEIPIPGRKWICWKRDLASAWELRRHGRLSIGEWIRSLAGRKRSADLMLADPMPTIRDALGRITGRR